MSVCLTLGQPYFLTINMTYHEIFLFERIQKSFKKIKCHKTLINKYHQVKDFFSLWYIEGKTKIEFICKISIGVKNITTVESCRYVFPMVFF